MRFFPLQVHSLSQAVHGSAPSTLPHYQALGEYTGEAFGVEYLYEQTGFMFPRKEDDLDAEIDEGFDDNMDMDVEEEETSHSEDMATVALPTDLESEEDEVRNHCSLL